MRVRVGQITGNLIVFFKNLFATVTTKNHTPHGWTFVRGILWWVIRKSFPCHDVIMITAAVHILEVAYISQGTSYISMIKCFYNNLYSCQSLLILFCNEFIHPLIPFDVTESDLLLIFLVAWKRSCGTAYELCTEIWNENWPFVLCLYIHVK